MEPELGCSLEAESRRHNWAAGGMAVRLADSALWHFPAVTPAVLKSTPGLRDDLRGVLAATIGGGRPPADDADGLASYCGRMEAVARQLLGANYDLTEYTWRALMTFDDNIGKFNMMMALSLVLDAAWVEWRPWLDAA